MTRVFIVDDHELVRRAFVELFRDHEDLQLIGQAGSVAEALERLEKADADVFVLDVRLPDGTGVELCREIRSRHPETACLMLSTFKDEGALLDAVMAGAAGYVLKDAAAKELLVAVRRLARGESLIDAATMTRLMSRIQAGSDEGGETPLAEQEKRILELVTEGLTNRQIASRLHLAEQTIKNCVSSLLRKLGVESRTQAAVYATRRSPRNR